MAGAEPNQSKERVAPTLNCFPGAPAGKWLRNGATEIQIGRQPLSLCHSTGPEETECSIPGEVEENRDSD